MIKCVHLECQWPECDKTCGMVPTGDYVIGSSAEEQLIYHLQERINQLLDDRAEMKLLLTDVQRTTALALKPLAWDYDEARACAAVCQHGYTDCVNNPEYERRNHTKYWVEEGMPTSCEECCYDDEDK